MSNQTRQVDSNTALLLEVVPAVLQNLRASMDFAGTPGLSMSQVRALTFVKHHPDCTLSQVAGHLGIGMSSASASVSRLARKGLLVIGTGSEDRRSSALSLSAQGLAVVAEARRQARVAMSSRLQSLSTAEQATLEEALKLLKSRFGKPG